MRHLMFARSPPLLELEVMASYPKMPALGNYETPWSVVKRLVERSTCDMKFQ
jgi:hypothetical protein